MTALKTNVYKIAAFNDHAAKQIETLLKDHYQTMRDFYVAVKSNNARSCGSLADHSKTPSSNITPVRQDQTTDEAKKDSKQKRPVRDSRQSNTSEHRSDVEEDDDLTFLEFEEEIGSKFRSHRQMVDLGSSSPTYSVTSESRPSKKPPTTMKTHVAEMPIYGNASKFSKNTPAAFTF